jgi:Microtubule-associated protein 70
MSASGGRNSVSSRRQSIGGADSGSKANGFLTRRPSFQMRSSSTATTIVSHAKGASKSFDGRLVNGSGHSLNGSTDVSENNSDEKTNGELPSSETEDTVSGLLYDMLQKEVISLRKSCHEKDQSLKDKDDAIEVISYTYVGYTLVI